jgi:hypothetical protein
MANTISNTNTKPHDLYSIIESKKNQMLLEDNPLNIQQLKVESILISNTKREKIFEEALLLERLYDTEIEKMKKAGVKATNQVPGKLQGIKPKHIRIGSESYDSE